jgi:hypothetical protein
MAYFGHRDFVVQVPSHNISMWHLWSAHPNPGANNMGIQTFFDPDYVRKLNTTLAAHFPWIVAPQPRSLSNVIIVVNSGAHDIGLGRQVPFVDFKHHMTRLAEQLDAYRRAGAQVIWRSNTPGWVWHTDLLPLDRLSYEALAGTSVPFFNISHVFEAHRAMEGFAGNRTKELQWWATHTDNIHFGTAVLHSDGYAGRTTNIIGALVFQELLHLVCPSSPGGGG